MKIFDLIYMNGWVNVHMQLAEMIPYWAKHGQTKWNNNYSKLNNIAGVA